MRIGHVRSGLSSPSTPRKGMARSGISSPSAGCQDTVRVLTEGRLTVYRGDVYGAAHWLGVSGLRVLTHGILYKVRLKKLTV